MTESEEKKEVDVSDDIFTRIVVFCEKTWDRILKQVQKFLREWHVYENLDALALHLARHPLLGLTAVAITLCCGIPILIFFLFAIMTIILTFTGFVIIEGTILTIGSVFLCGFLLSTLIIGLTMASIAGVVYFGFMKIYGLRQPSPENSPLYHFLPVKFREQFLTANHHGRNVNSVHCDHED